MRDMQELADYIDQFWYKYRTLPNVIYVSPELFLTLTATETPPNYVIWKHHKGVISIKPRNWDKFKKGG